MMPTEYDLRLVEYRCREMRRDAADYRLANSHRMTPINRPTLIARLRALFTHAPTRQALPIRSEAPA